MPNPQVKLASLLFWRWEFWRDPRWQKNARYSGGTWIVSALISGVLLAQWLHGLVLLIVWNIVSDAVTYVINRKEIFPDRKVRFWHSGSLSVAVSIFCFAYHKATALLLLAVLGLGFYWVVIIQGVIGILENPVRYKFNLKVAFAESPSTESP